MAEKYDPFTVAVVDEEGKMKGPVTFAHLFERILRKERGNPV